VSCYHEYFDAHGTKSLRAYSAPFNLARFDTARWLVSAEKLDWLATALDQSRHYPSVSHNILASLTKVSLAKPYGLHLSEAAYWFGKPLSCQ
jgi:hypothetical protein